MEPAPAPGPSSAEKETKASSGEQDLESGFGFDGTTAPPGSPKPPKTKSSPSVLARALSYGDAGRGVEAAPPKRILGNASSRVHGYAFEVLDGRENKDAAGAGDLGAGAGTGVGVGTPNELQATCHVGGSAENGEIARDHQGAAASDVGRHKIGSPDHQTKKRRTADASKHNRATVARGGAAPSEQRDSNIQAKAVATQRLQYAKEQGIKRREAISRPPIIVGTLTFLPSGLWFVLAKLLPALGIAEGILPYAWFGGCLGTVSIPILLVALLPEDIARVKLVVKMISLVFGFGCFCAFGLVAMMVMHHINGCTDALGITNGGPVPCWYSGLSVIWPCLFSAGYGIVARHLWYYQQHQPARTLLRTTWQAIGTFYIGLSFVFSLNWLPRLSFEPINVDTCAQIFLCVLLLVSGRLFLSNTFREDTQRWLQARSSWSMNSAAAIASLIGNQSEEELFRMANEVFTGVDIDRVTEAAIKRKDPDPSLNKLAHHAAFNKVDAFFSHSWSDNPDKKWAAMQRWRQQFRAAHSGREPIVWIDKYCLDQNRILDSLAVLPLSLAGCRKLVIFYGPSYLSRLWCIIELFVFLEMGKELSDIELRKLDTSQQDEDVMRKEIRQFDASKAQCYSPEERDAMLTLIEAGSGTLEAFSAQISSMLNGLLDSSKEMGSTLAYLDGYKIPDWALNGNAKPSVKWCLLCSHYCAIVYSRACPAGPPPHPAPPHSPSLHVRAPLSASPSSHTCVHARPRHIGAGISRYTRVISKCTSLTLRLRPAS
mmetsp:Transcript_16066/g.37435  ORF Transcript_16066/g.37435 Transcript_16066/m.37435 type:complete len:770 (+) Transcript_16066:44-2353(+)